jgi:thioredoxin reductase
MTRHSIITIGVGFGGLAMPIQCRKAGISDFLVVDVGDNGNCSGLA